MEGTSKVIVALVVVIFSWTSLGESISLSRVDQDFLGLSKKSFSISTERLSSIHAPVIRFLRRQSPRIIRRPRRRVSPKCAKYVNYQFRPIDGSCNNLALPHVGSAHQPFLVLSKRLRSESEIRKLPNPRHISNVLNNERIPVPNKRGMSEMVIFFGQFMDHTITETEQSKKVSMDIKMSRDDPVFFREGKMSFFRTIRKRAGRWLSPENKLSSYIDAASVHGVNKKMSQKLRLGSFGRLKMPNDMLPRKKKNGEFLAGDSRANENPALTAIHTLWAREHNTISEEVAHAYPHYNDEEIFQLSRHILSAELQAVTYYGFIPALTGRLLPKYKGYNPRIPAIISNRFSSVAFRVGHTLLNTTINAVDENGRTRKLELADCFFKPNLFVRAGMNNLLRGMMRGHAAEVDLGVSGQVRNFLKTSDKATRFDLSALNIQRGRDHGVPACNELRRSMGLKPFRSFQELTKNPHLIRKLRFLYFDKIEDVDAWVCGLIEPHVKGSSLGLLFDQIIRREFGRLRDGDRFYFERPGYFTQDQIAKLPLVRTLVSRDPAKLKKIMREIIYVNTEIPYDQINPDPFFV